MKKLMMLAALFTALASKASNTWYVDDDNYGKSGDGTTTATAYGTIQEAIDAETTHDGDTIRVLPGIYSNGVYEAVADTSMIRARVAFTKKVYVEATGKKEETHIVGAKTFGQPGDDALGNGTNAIRCVYVPAGGRYSWLMGFTLRDGATRRDIADKDTLASGGGAIGVSGTKTGLAGYFHVVDCVISNNVSYYSAAASFGGTLVRCLVVDNQSGRNYAVMYYGAALYSVFARNKSGGTGSYMTLTSTFVNCTLTENTGPCVDGSCYNCLFSMNSDLSLECGGSGNFATLSTTDDLVTLMAPLKGDYRPIVGSLAVNYGETRYLTTEKVLALPDGIDLRDMAGEPVRTDSDKITAGAYQTAVEPPYGGIMLPKGVSVDGGESWSATNIVLFPTTWPVQYCVTGGGTAGNRLVADANGTVDVMACHYPDSAGTYHLTPPYAAGTVQTNRYQSTGVNRTVSPKVDYSALQNALLEKQSKGLKITVEAGEYGVETNSVAYRGVTNCVSRIGAYFYVMAASEGPEKTVIRGRAAKNERDPAAYPGCGPDAVRCVNHHYSSDYDSTLCLIGFTIADGRTDCGQADAVAKCGGAAYGRDNDNGKARETSLVFVDCVFTNCWAPDAGVGVNATFIRCKFVDCGSAGVGFRNCILSSCVFENCDFGLGTFGLDCRAVNCTDASGKSVSTASGVQLLNSHIADTAISDLAKNFGTSADGVFTDATEGDWRPFAGSPSVDATRRPFPADADYATCAEWFAAFATSDFEGRTWTFGGGFPLAGAYQDVGRGVLLETSAPYGFSVSGAEIGPNPLVPGDSLTIARDPAAIRPCGIVVNGVTNLLENGATYTYTETGAGDFNAGRIVGIVDPNWYVDADAGDDRNDGFSAATPKQTLKGVLSVATNAGDVVHAAAGVYNRETMPSEGTDVPTIKIRAVVAPDVTLVGAGAETTVIQGVRADDDTATRGVYLGERARLVGFTVCNCSTTNGANGAAVSAERFKNTVVADCILSNNAAWSGAAVCGVNYVLRSRLLNNCSTQPLSADPHATVASNYSSFYNCLFDDNSGESWLSKGATTYNCTIGKRGTGKCLRDVASYRSLIYKHPRDEANLNTCYLSLTSGYAIVWNDSVITNEAALAFVDPTYAPVIGENIAIGKGDWTAYTNGYPVAYDPKGPEYDLYGNPRVSNGTMDIGAVEADFRPLYAKVVGGRRCRVTRAAPAVVLSDGGSVLVPAEASLEAVWAGQNGQDVSYQLNFRVNGTGTLAVTVNGETRTYTQADGAVAWAFRNALPENAVSFAFADGDGQAEILQGWSGTGIIIVVR